MLVSPDFRFRSVFWGIFCLLTGSIWAGQACSTSKKTSPAVAQRPAHTPPPAPPPPATGMDPRPEIERQYASTIYWLNSERLMPVLEEAQRLHKPVFVDFTAVWCAPCKVMEEEIFSQSVVADPLNAHFLSFRTDYDGAAGRTIADIYEVKALPSLLFLDPNGVVLERHTGMISAAELIRLTESARVKMQGR